MLFSLECTKWAIKVNGSVTVFRVVITWFQELPLSRCLDTVTITSNLWSEEVKLGTCSTFVTQKSHNHCIYCNWLHTAWEQLPLFDSKFIRQRPDEFTDTLPLIFWRIDYRYTLVCPQHLSQFRCFLYRLWKNFPVCIERTERNIKLK